MISRIYFDDSLPRFAELVVEFLGPEALANNLFLRDAMGFLTFVLLDNVPSKKREALSRAAIARLSPYVEKNGFAVATPDELFDEGLNSLNSARKVRVAGSQGELHVFIVDRRMVGADWMRQPTETAEGPLRVVFASLKGGVGRTTALCIAAAHFASRGLRVLAIDMDLEAPGLGSMLLSDETLPAFGLLDYMVEQGVGELDDSIMAEMLAPSWLARGKGRVDVIPAIGRRCMTHPENVLGKIARAYLASTSAGMSKTFADHLLTVVDAFSAPNQYDLILIDARAGMHETTAAAVVGLGAEVLFFGLDQPQTFSGYKLLLSHLATLPKGAGEDWRERFHFVHAKAPELPGERQRFATDITALQLEVLWRDQTVPMRQIDVSELKGTFEVEWAETGPWDAELPDGPAEVLYILDDTRYARFDPITDASQLEGKVYRATFGDFLSALNELLRTDER